MHVCLLVEKGFHYREYIYMYMYISEMSVHFIHSFNVEISRATTTSMWSAQPWLIYYIAYAGFFLLFLFFFVCFTHAFYIEEDAQSSHSWWTPLWTQNQPSSLFSKIHASPIIPKFFSFWISLVHFDQHSPLLPLSFRLRLLLPCNIIADLLPMYYHFNRLMNHCNVHYKKTGWRRISSKCFCFCNQCCAH